MLIHDVVAEYLLTQGDTEVREYDIGRTIEALTHQVDGEPTPLSLQYYVSIHLKFWNAAISPFEGTDNSTCCIKKWPFYGQIKYSPIKDFYY